MNEQGDVVDIDVESGKLSEKDGSSNRLLNEFWLNEIDH